MYICIYVYICIHIYDSIYMKSELTCAYVCVCVYMMCIHSILTCVYTYWGGFTYGVATISRLLKMIGLFCKIWSLL